MSLMSPREVAIHPLGDKLYNLRASILVRKYQELGRTTLRANAQLPQITAAATANRVLTYA